MKCPKCNSYLPDNAASCGCGYSAANHSGNTRSAQNAGKPPTGLWVAGWLFAALGGLIGAFIAGSIAYGKSAGAYKYDADARRTGKVMLTVSIVVFVAFAALKAVFLT